MTDNREHLERLFLETGDGALTDREIRRCAKLARILSGWRCLDARVDWAAAAGRTAACIRNDVEAQASAQADQAIDATVAVVPNVPGAEQTARVYRAVDNLLQDTAGPMPAVDWNALAARISAAVRREARPVSDSAFGGFRHRRAMAWVIRIGAPMAVAAAIVLAVWGLRTDVRVTPDRPAQARPIITIALEEPNRSDGTIRITFDESRPVGGPFANGAAFGSGIAVGPPVGEMRELPIDPLMLP